MLALTYSFGLFLIWTVVGRAVLEILSPRFGALRSWLLAPGLGLAAILLTLMALNQLGWPIGRFAAPMTLGWLAVAAAVLWLRRPVVSPRALGPFVLAAVVSLAWTGWPALEVGFNWVSYGNDDMANYCLAAQRFTDHGFFDVPTMAELSGRDYASYYFFMHVADMMRFGAEHIVAWTATLGHLKATQAFMPVILALALTQLFAAAGLVLQSGRRRRHALATAWILAASPLFMLGTLYQLIAQVGGIALLLVTLALLTRSGGTTRRRDLIRYAVLPSVSGAALCIYYPEATPFAVLAYLGFTGLALLRRRLSPAVAVALTAYVLVGVLVLLRYNLISYISTLVMQFTSAMHGANLLLSLFPYFLIPTGFSNLFGWMPIFRDFPEPVVSVTIVAGMLLAGVLLWRAVVESWRLAVASILLAVQVLLAVQLYRAGNDFGLYKLAMFMQPALAAAIAGLVPGWLRPRQAAAGIALFALTTAPTALSYTRASQGLQSGGVTELRFGSRLGMQIAAPADRDAQITAAVENVVAAKFAASELRGRQLAFASRDYFFPNTRIDFRDPPLPVLFHPHFAEMARARPLMLERNRDQVTTSMLWLTEFSQPVLARETDYYLFLANQLSLFNKFGRPAAPAREVFVLEPAASVQNRLIFVHSGRGNHYYLGDRRRISFFQQEPDPEAPARDFNGIGRFMLLRVEHPSEQIYLRIAATRTPMPSRPAWSPEAVVHAAEDRPLGAVGHGAMNLFVGPLRPQPFQGAAYVAIDFHDIPQTILDRRKGLKALYNRYISLDYRRLIGYARDISVVSAAEYQALRRPSRLANFPEDLVLAETLEFSGIYEDGWLSPQSKFVLGASAPGGCVRLRGEVPALPGTVLGTGALRLTLEDRELAVPAGSGVFDWLIPVAHAADATRIGLRFTAIAKLPDGDDRPTAARLELLEVLTALPTHTFDYATPGAPRLAAAGIDQDGWMAQSASIELPATDAPAQIVLRVEFPDWGSKNAATLRLQLSDSGAATAATLGSGQYTTVRVRLPASPTARTLRLDAAADFPLPAPDTRRRACRLLQVDLAPDA